MDDTCAVCACISFLFGRRGWGGSRAAWSARGGFVGTSEGLFIIISGFYSSRIIVSIELVWCGMMAMACVPVPMVTAWPVISKQFDLKSSTRGVACQSHGTVWQAGPGVLLLRCCCGGVRWGIITVHVMRVFQRVC